MAMTDTTEPLFSIDAFIRRTVRLFGAIYELKHPDELGIVDNALIGRLGATVNAAQTGDDISEDAVAKALDTMCRIVLIAPDDVHVRLTDSNRLRLVQAFTRLASAPQAEASAKEEGPATTAPEGPIADPSTGEK